MRHQLNLGTGTPPNFKRMIVAPKVQNALRVVAICPNRRELVRSNRLRWSDPVYVVWIRANLKFLFLVFGIDTYDGNMHEATLMLATRRNN